MKRNKNTNGYEPVFIDLSSHTLPLKPTDLNRLMAHRFKLLWHFCVDRKLLEEELHIVDTRPRTSKDLKIPCTRPPTWRVECLRIGFRTGPPGGQGHHLSTAQQMAIFLLLVDVVDLILAGGRIVTHDLGQDPVLIDSHHSHCLEREGCQVHLIQRLHLQQRWFVSQRSFNERLQRYQSECRY